MAELQDLLDRASDAIEPNGVAAQALREARRRRGRRRVTAAALATTTAVAVVVVGARVVVGGPDASAPPPAETPSATALPSVAPEIPRDRIQPVWDPTGVEGLPVTDLGVPRVIGDAPSGVVTRPVAVLDDGRQALLVGADAVAPLDLPAGIGRWRTVSLSPDGRRIAAAGLSGFFWRPIDGDWRRVEVEGAAVDEVLGERTELTWTGDSRSVVLRTHLAGRQVHLDTGAQRRLSMLRDYVSWGFAPDGGVFTVPRPGWLGPLESLQRPVLDETSIAAARANTSWGEERRTDDADGLIAVDRETLETRAFLRVPYEHAWYVDGGNLTPVAWLSEDVVAFRVRPLESPKEYLVTWDVETGALSRISCWDGAYRAVFATGLLG